MVEMRGVSCLGATIFDAGLAARPANRHRNALIALLLAGAAMTPVPVTATTLDLLGATVLRTDLDTGGVNYDFVENGILRLNNAGVYSFGGVLRDGGGVLSFEKIGPNTVVLSGANTYSGDTRITAGTLRTAADNTLSANSLLRVNALLDLDGYDQTVRGIVGSGTIQNVSGGTAALTINNTGTNTFSGTISDSAGNALTIVKTGAGRENLNAVNNYAGGTQIAAGRLGYGAAGSLGSGTVTFTGPGSLVANGANVTLSNNIVLNSGGTIDDGGSVTSFSGVVSGAGSLTKTGTGQVTLVSAANTYTGGTNLLAGRLVLGGDNSLGTDALTVSGVSRLGATATATIANNVILNSGLVVDTGTVRFNGVVSGAGTPLSVDNGATLILGSANTYSGTTQIVNGSVLGVTNNNAIGGGGQVIVSGSGTLRAYANGLTLNNLFRAGSAFTVDTNGNDLTIAGKINNINAGQQGSLVVMGGGSLTLSNVSNNYALGTTVTGSGTLQVSSDAQLGSGAAGIALNGGNLRILGTGYTSTARTITLTNSNSIDIAAAANSFTAGPITGSGGFFKFGAGNLTLNGGNTYTGFTYIDNGSLTVTANSAISSNVLYIVNSQFIAGAAGLSFGNQIEVANAVINTQANTLTFTGLIENASGITKTGSGTLIVTGAGNTYSGGTTVSGGELRASADNALGTGTVSLASGATLSAGGNVTLANAIALSAGAESIDDRGNLFVLNGAITGSGGYFTVGSGTVVLNGVNTYSGGTTASFGTLRVNSSTGTGNTFIDTPATLSGTGTLAGTTQVSGTVAPGNGIGTLTATNLLLNSGSLLNFDLSTPGIVGGAANDLIIVSNNLTLDGTLNVNALGGFGAGTYRLFNYSGVLTNNTLDLGALPGVRSRRSARASST